MSHSMRNRMVAIALAVAAATACRSEPAFMRLAQARDLSADLTVQFVTAVDAGNKVIIAESDDGSAAFGRDAEAAKQAVQADIDALRPILGELNYAPEADALQAFAARFEEYRKLDQQILGLAVENTNRKAQRLSFGTARQEADAFRDALNTLEEVAGANAWHGKALAATAVAAVREIQWLQAPHIAEAGDAAMTEMEKRMTVAETAARNALQALRPLAGAASRPQLAAANAALDRFMTVHADILVLSRRNTNVRSLALSLNEKGRLTGRCEDSLRELREGLAKRGFAATR